MATAKAVRLSGSVVELSTFDGDRLVFQAIPLWELVEAVAEQMGVDVCWRDAAEFERIAPELDRIKEAILLAAEGVVDELIDGLRRYAETGEENDASRYMADCLRLLRQREGARA